MTLNQDIFNLFNRQSFTYRQGDESTKKEYMEQHKNWSLWCKELAQKVNKFEMPTIQSWQNSGQLARYFWARFKYTPFMNSAACISMHAEKDEYSVELSYEIKNEDSDISKEEYNSLLFLNLRKWVETNVIDTKLFHIRAKTNRCTLEEYFNIPEKNNWFTNSNGINISIGISFDVNQAAELDTESEFLIDILKKLCDLYEKVQRPNHVYNSLLKAKDIVPDEYDGSYQLVREIVKAYELVPNDVLTLDDLDAMFFMCVGTFKHKADTKRQLIKKSKLPESEKDRIIELINKIENKSKALEYGHTNEGAGNFGMFGEAVGTFRAFYKENDDITGARTFIKMCIDISKMDNEEDMFDLCDKVMKAGVKGIQTGKVSKFLHCLKPCTFPILNERQGKGTSVYDSLGIKLNKADKATNYINNVRIIKDYRDKYFTFKNYRVMDIVDEENSEAKYWLGGASYDSDDVSEDFIKQNVFAIGWADENLKNILEDKDKLQKVYDKYELNDHAQKMINLFFELKAGDKIGIKSTFAKGHTSILRIKAIGTVQKGAHEGYVYSSELVHTIPVKWERVKQFDLEGVGGYWNTLSEVTKIEDIDKIFFNKFEDSGEKHKDKDKDEDKEEPTFEPYTKEQLLEDAFITEEKYNTIVSRLENKKNIILQGAPGVGKSYLAKKIAYSIMGKIDESKVQMIQFHQSYSYEDFIMGYRPNKDGGFDVIDGVFYKFCKMAISDPEDKFYFIIDEINRGNLSKVFGELMLLIEVDKRGESYAMSTVYSEEKFYIPDNLYIIGLMNTADRSLALIDYALRRRFSFIDIEPAFGENFKKYTERFKHTKLDRVLSLIQSINEDIEADESLGKGFKIGHSYFCNLKTASDYELLEIIDCDIIPLLEEYWIESTDKVKNYSITLHGALANE